MGASDRRVDFAGQSGFRARLIRGLTLFCCGIVVNETSTAAQVAPDCDPDVDGFSTGFWELGSQINDQLPGQPAIWSEITHAAVLPPPNDRYILFWCERDVTDCNAPFEQYETWMFNWFNPNRPLRKIVVPQPLGSEGATDLFCGGHSFGKDGQVHSFGGTDFVLQCSLGTGRLGHNQVWTFDNAALTSTSTPAWHDGGSLSGMQDIRWYPSAIALGDGDQLVLGDFECPGCSQVASTTRQRGRTVSTSTWQFAWNSTTNNYFNSVSEHEPTDPGFCADSSDVYMYQRGYPQIHVVPGGYVFSHAANLWIGPSPTVLPFVGTTLLDLNLCAGIPGMQETERWVRTDHLDPPGQPPQPLEFRGSTVLIVDDRQVNPNQPSSVVYAIGGDTAALSEHGCPCHAGISDQVLRMVNPSPAASWDSGVPQLKRTRKYANAVLMLDGSIIVFSGMGKELDSGGAWTGNCVYHFRPEMLKPQEVFGTSPTSWQILCQTFHRHAHHSVAGALPNGQAFLAGGDDAEDHDCNVPPPTNAGIHVIEMFSPPYMFQGPAPEIVAVAPTDPLQGDTISGASGIRVGSG